MFGKLKKWQAEKPPGNSPTEHQGQEVQLHNFPVRAGGQVGKHEKNQSQLKHIALQSSVGEVVQQVHGGELHDISQICKKVQAEGQRVGDDKGELFLEREQTQFS